ncbi:MAG: prephenate dehydrogenase/arogenate dehydrogenase family protein [Salinisphaeraceae bacterium]|nr:prephenate dehydrogenase/arogenate dehydrogenase family protein [Salinisphaeraceae bacterium]
MSEITVSNIQINRLCIIGVGLIGGSLARALKKADAVETVIGCGRGVENLQSAQALGVIDAFEQDPAKAVAGADLVVLAMPVSSTAQVYAQIQAQLDTDCIVTDVGSTKGSVIADLRDELGALPPNFVPGHPIAGTEHSGVQASFAELFIDRRVILTPESETAADAVATVAAVWGAAGASVVEMDAAHHDEVLAATSHLPHLLAYGLVDTLATMEERREIFNYAAGGFRDFTRIASSNPDMWADIVLANREALLPVAERFLADLEGLRAAIEKGDRETVQATFSRAKTQRDRFASLVGRFVKAGDLE